MFFKIHFKYIDSSVYKLFQNHQGLKETMTQSTENRM